jgi:hypothetical protein
MPIAAVLCLCIVTPAGTSPAEEAALAWIKRVDGELTKPRYAKLTLDQLSKLEELQLGGHRKSDNKHLFVPAAEFHHLTALKGLKKLHLGENDGVTDAAVVHVGNLTGLRSLVLWDAPMTDDGLKHLLPLKELSTSISRSPPRSRTPDWLRFDKWPSSRR